MDRERISPEKVGCLGNCFWEWWWGDGVVMFGGMCVREITLEVVYVCMCFRMFLLHGCVCMCVCGFECFVGWYDGFFVLGNAIFLRLLPYFVGLRFVETSVALLHIKWKDAESFFCACDTKVAVKYDKCKLK